MKVSVFIGGSIPGLLPHLASVYDLRKTQTHRQSVERFALRILNVTANDRFRYEPHHDIGRRCGQGQHVGRVGVVELIFLKEPRLVSLNGDSTRDQALESKTPILIGHLDAELREIVFLSLGVSLTASICAFVIGAPLGAALAIYRFRGKGAVIIITNALLGLPPVVVGLAVYLLLSRSGPLGSFGILFTPTAMVIAQAVLATPIVIALVHRMMVEVWAAYGDALLADGASRLRAIPPIMLIGRDGLLTGFLAAFGRAIAEVGAIIIVGGNIRGYTRTMTTAIALETSKGELSFALALGIILVCLSMAVSGLSLFFGRALTSH